MLGGHVLAGIGPVAVKGLVHELECSAAYSEWLQLFRSLESRHGTSSHQYLLRKHRQRPDPE